MDSEQLKGILAADAYTGKIETDVLPADMAPTDPVSLPCAYIFNTDPASKPGTHWVAVYFNTRGRGYYFDPLGVAPSSSIAEFFFANGKSHAYNHHQIQSAATDACGHYCVMFLGRCARGHPPSRIVSQFSSREPGFFDGWVKQMVECEFEHVNRMCVKCNQGCK